MSWSTGVQQNVVINEQPWVLTPRARSSPPAPSSGSVITAIIAARWRARAPMDAAGRPRRLHEGVVPTKWKQQPTSDTFSSTTPKLLIQINYSLLPSPISLCPFGLLFITKLNVWLWSTVALNAISFQSGRGRVIVSVA